MLRQEEAWVSPAQLRGHEMSMSTAWPHLALFAVLVVLVEAVELATKAKEA